MHRVFLCLGWRVFHRRAMRRVLLHRRRLPVKMKERLWAKRLGRPWARHRVKLWGRLLEKLKETAWVKD
jgi:hypothetical protein